MRIEAIMKGILKASLAFMICYGLVLVVAQIKPFWVDEWRIIYNLKFKSLAELWGPLDYMQQAPRAYLSLLKVITAAGDYSYTALRLPSFLIGTGVILLSYRLMQILFAHGANTRFLFVAIIVSCYTFTEYFVQVKQYTMDLLLSLTAIWLLLRLPGQDDGSKSRTSSYILLCTVAGIIPFFSYTYPIAVAPVYGVVLIDSIKLWRSRDRRPTRHILRQWLPLCISAASIVAFYALDVRQLLADEQMQDYWKEHLTNQDQGAAIYLTNIFKLFAQAGSGLVAEILFGVLGLCATIYGVSRSIKAIKRQHALPRDQLCLYSTLLLFCVIVLYSVGKLPLGEPRLCVFAIPAIAFLNTNALEALKKRYPRNPATAWFPALLCLAVLGNLYTSFIGIFTSHTYARQMTIYSATEKALTQAAVQHLPIAITPGVAYPYDNTVNLPFKNTVPGDWVLKTFPAYKVSAELRVTPINDIGEWQRTRCNSAAADNVVMAGDGIVYRLIRCR